jgi:endo-1,3(4)-beta-glucanase
VPPSAGQFFQIDLGKRSSFDSIELNAAGDKNDYPRSYRVWASGNGNTWRSPVATGQGSRALTDIDSQKQSARFARIEQTGTDADHWWSIADVKLRLTGTVS